LQETTNNSNNNKNDKNLYQSYDDLATTKKMCISSKNQRQTMAVYSQKMVFLFLFLYKKKRDFRPAI